MPKTILTLTTDFGQVDHYVAQMKGAVLSINPDVQLVDVTHEIPPQNIAKASYVMHDILEVFPPGTIHVCVVDPGVGSHRPIIAAELGGQRFVAPDNGVLGLAAEKCRPSRVVEVINDRYWRQPTSKTFHGRDIMAPVAAHWSLGVEMVEFGQLRETPPAALSADPPSQTATATRGTVLWADRFGNLITNIRADELPGNNSSNMRVEVGGHVLTSICRYYSEQPTGALLALIGSSGLLEIAVNGGSAEERLSLGEGTTVLVKSS